MKTNTFFARLLLCTTLVGASLLASGQLQAANWTVDASGNWTDDTKWNPSHPSGVDTVADLTTAISGDRVITLDAPITIGTLNINYTFSAASNEYTIAGANALTFEVASGSATITRPNGRVDTISAPVVLNSNLVVDLPNTSGTGNLQITGVISGNKGIERIGGPDGVSGIRLTLQNAGNSYTEDTVITAGRLRTSTSMGSIPNGAGKGNVVIGASGGLELSLGNNGTETINGLSGSGFVVHGGTNGQTMTLFVGDNDATGFNYAGSLQIESVTNPGTRRLNFEKIGAGTQTLSGNSTYNGTTKVTSGTLLVNGTHAPATPDTPGDPNVLLGAYTVAGGATLGGTGAIAAAVTVDAGGFLAPGTSIESLAVNSVAGAGTVVIEYDGDAGTDLVDLLSVSGNLDISSLAIDFNQLGDALNDSAVVLASYGSLTGTAFSSVTDLPAGYGLNYNYLSGNQIALVSMHPGDFDGDGDVDGADFVAWQTHFPTASGATLADGDADGDHDVDGADFVVWQTNFPFTPGPGASPVPEPGSMFLLLIGGLLVGRRYCRRQGS